MSYEDTTRIEHRTPVIQLWGRIVVPLQGDITDGAAAALVDDVLRTLQSSSAAGLVVDVTGMWTVDSHLCHVIVNLAATARLMGTPTVLCGMSAAVAITLQTMGIEFELLRTALTLEDALEHLGVEARLHEVDSTAFEPPSHEQGETSHGYSPLSPPRVTNH